MLLPSQIQQKLQGTSTRYGEEIFKENDIALYYLYRF